MSEHHSFVIAAYAAATVILAWCAFAPVLRTRAVQQRLKRVFSRTGNEHKA